ncbi:hypothetical protein SAMN04487977_101471 [Treponema bryantii]|uniref:Uncharacterized protein n=1 Tax=Treponema bryantii TaxID=163 RepID=A0A1H9AUG4_9SPIR|nr:hypothetical protein [Treponema bryantii]SEP80269.1 hypothetical protein SAMN04487977_101471 [Treponema bryantii]
MATVKMFKGNIIADIYDSPETIATAKAQGYNFVEDEPKAKKDEAEGESKSQAKTKRQ